MISITDALWLDDSPQELNHFTRYLRVYGRESMSKLNFMFAVAVLVFVSSIVMNETFLFYLSLSMFVGALWEAYKNFDETEFDD